MTILVDDHLLRDWLAGPDPALRRAVGHHELATTNLWYSRLCKSAAATRSGAQLSRWPEENRAALVRALVVLPDSIEIIPMRVLAWRMGFLVSEHTGLSTLGAEAIAAAEALGARLLVSARDDGPGIRRCCTALRLGYRALPRSSHRR